MTKLAEEIQRLERFVASGDADQALQGYERLLAQMPRDPVLRKRVDFLRDSLHRHAPDWQVSTYVISPQAVAEAHIMDQHYAEALEILEWMLEAHPEDTGLARRVAMVRAMRDGNDAPSIEPTASTHVMSAETLVEAHTAAGEIEAALRLLKALIAQRTDNARLKQRLAALEAAWGQSADELPPAELAQAPATQDQERPVARAADAVYGAEQPAPRERSSGPVTRAAEEAFGASDEEAHDVFTNTSRGPRVEAAQEPGVLGAMYSEAQQTIKRDRLERRVLEPPGGPTQRPPAPPIRPPASPAPPAPPAPPASRKTRKARKPGSKVAAKHPPVGQGGEGEADSHTRPGKHSAKIKPPTAAEEERGKTKKRSRKKSAETTARRKARKLRRRLGEGSGKDLIAGDPHSPEGSRLLGTPPEEVTETAAVEEFDIHEQLTMPEGEHPLFPRVQGSAPMASPDDFDELSTLAEARPLPRGPVAPSAMDLFDDDDEPTVADSGPPSALGGEAAAPKSGPTRSLRSQKKKKRR